MFNFSTSINWIHFGVGNEYYWRIKITKKRLQLWWLDMFYVRLTSPPNFEALIFVMNRIWLSNFILIEQWSLNFEKLWNIYANEDKTIQTFESKVPLFQILWGQITTTSKSKVPKCYIHGPSIYENYWHTEIQQSRQPFFL